MADDIVLEVFAYFLAALFSLLAIYKLVFLVDGLVRPAQGYEAAFKKTKGFWILLLGVSFGFDALMIGLAFRNGGGLLSAAVIAPPGSGFVWMISSLGIVATTVYNVDVRPAVKAITGGRGTGGRSNAGPYGPW